MHPRVTCTCSPAGHHLVLQTIRPVVPVGSITAYNQAGLPVPSRPQQHRRFLGLCSRFYASLPSTDVYFTEGGRYVALTNKPRLRVHEAYLLYRNAQFILSGTDVLRRANGSAIPSRFSAIGISWRPLTTATTSRSIAESSNRLKGSLQPPARSSKTLLTSCTFDVRPSTERQSTRDYAWRFPFLRDGTANFQFTGSFSIDVQFARADERVYAVSIDEVRATRQASLAITLLGTGGRIVDR